MTEGFLDDRIYYRHHFVSDERPTLVFIHGLSGSSSAWLPYEEYFKSSYSTVSFDLRGEGQSFRPNKIRQYSIAKIADDVHELLAFLKVRRAVLIGHSFGTLIALQLLRKEPGRFDAAVFISANYGISQTLRGKILAWIIRWVARIASAFPFSTRRGIDIDYTVYGSSGDWNVRRMIADIHNTRLRSYLLELQDTYGSHLDPLWRHITIPTLIIHGQKDSFIPVANAISLSKDIPNAEFHIVPEANHVLVINPRHMVVIEKLIEEFLQKVEK